MVPYPKKGEVHGTVPLGQKVAARFRRRKEKQSWRTKLFAGGSMDPITAAPAAPNNPPLRETFLTEEQLANELPKCNVRKLRDWRNLRIGPPWLKLGREVVYLRTSVDEWMRARELGV